jgi:hypothetical protein
MTLFLHARLANIFLALLGLTTSPCAPPWINSRSSSRSRIDGSVREGKEGSGELTCDSEFGTLAHGLSRELYPLSEGRFLIHYDFEPVHAEHIEVFHRSDLVVRR